MMERSVLSQLISSVRPRSILRDITTFWGCHSTVNGPGLRAASEFLVRRHHENGVAAEVRAYAADDSTPYLDGLKLPLAWFPRSASLEIIEPHQHAGVICSFENEPLCLISNSAGTPPGGINAEVVVIPQATEASAYEGLDLAGKIILTDVWPLQADGLARKHGAAGLLTDSVTPPWLAAHPPVRAAADVPDLTMWGILNGHPVDTSLWGFSLTPRQGARLREIIRQSKAPVVLRAVIDASLEPGKSELTSAVLPGGDLVQEEIWILSHSSEPGALDNASGCCASIEIARMLKGLTDSGVLPPLRRTIRFLSAVETEGYLPYIQERLADLPDVKAALALDSIGSDFRKTGGTMLVTRSPDYNPSFADDLLEHLLAAVAAQGNDLFTSDHYDLFPWRVDPCFPGNDNMIADGFFNIPTPMFVCWPDKFYHSNLDTPDKLSEGSLARATVIAAAYAYLLASAGLPEARWMASLTLQAWKHRLIASAALHNRGPLQGVDALRSILYLEPELQAQIEAMVDDLIDFARRELTAAARWNTPSAPAQAGVQPLPEIPTVLQSSCIKPLQWKPPNAEQLSDEGKTHLAALQQEHPKIEDTWWLINGHRSAAEVCTRSPHDPQAVLSYLGLLLSEARIQLLITGD